MDYTVKCVCVCVLSFPLSILPKKNRRIPAIGLTLGVWDFMLIHYISVDFDIGLLAIVFKERFTEICLITFILGRVMRTVYIYT